MSDTDKIDFLSPLQRRLISVALVILALNLIGAFFFGLFLLLRWIVGYLSDILWPLAVAGILALLLRPLVFWCQQKLKTGRIGAILLLYCLALFAAAVMTALILPVILAQAGSFVGYLPTLFDQVASHIARFWPEFGDWIQSHLSTDALHEHLIRLSGHFQKIMQVSLPALNKMGEFVTRGFTLVAGFVIIPVYLFFFLLADKNPLHTLKDQLSFVPLRIREDFTFLVEEFARIMVAFFRGQILIGMIMGVLMALGFSVINLKFGVFLGVLIGLLNIIPYLGSILGLLTVLPLAYFQDEGGLMLLLMVLGVFILVQLLESYLLTPRIMGRSTGLHPLAIIIAIFFWGKALNGILGMILAIPLTAFFVVVWRLLRKKYLDPDHPEWPAV